MTTRKFIRLTHGPILHGSIAEKTLNKDIWKLTVTELLEVAGETTMDWSLTLSEIVKRRCRGCGCTQDDCSQCIEKTGHPCSWVEEDLCSACEK